MRAPNSTSDWSGVGVRPWSESLAEQHWGLLGRWESLLFPLLITGSGETGRTTSMQLPRTLPAATMRKIARTTKVSTNEGDRGVETNKGSLSLYIVALERRGTDPMDPLIS